MAPTTSVLERAGVDEDGEVGTRQRMRLRATVETFETHSPIVQSINFIRSCVRWV